jgi:colanic acid biosynthesis glycosyl transferase WcaI
MYEDALGCALMIDIAPRAITGGFAMKVCLVGLNYVPELTGIAPYTAGLAEGLSQRGFDVRVVTAYPHYPAWRIPESYQGQTLRELVDGVPVTRIRPYLPAKPAGLGRLGVELYFGIRSALVNWGRPDVVVLVSPALFAVAFAQIRARLTPSRPKVIVWVQDLYSLGVTETGTLGGVGARLMKKIESRVLRTADAVVVIHDRFKKYVSSNLSVEPASVQVVRNWTHIPTTVLDRDAYRAKFGWNDEIVVLHAGNMGVKQALENVVEAARLADSGSVPVVFVLLGNGSQRANLERLGADVQSLRFIDSLSDEDFRGAMAAADILLVNEKPGVTEMAVPSKLTSYFAAGRPVIAATDSGSITAEEVNTAKAGVRVNAGMPGELLSAAVDLGQNRARSLELGQNGAVFRENVLTRDTAISAYARIIGELRGVGG